MRDGMTAKMERPPTGCSFTEYSDRCQVKIVLLNSEHAGQEYRVGSSRVTLGRGPGVDLAFDDAAMSRQHAALEFEDGVFRVVDLGSTNGVDINECPADAGDIRHGDRFRLGGLDFQLVIDERDDEPDVYELPGE